ncbi:HlyC/CorC family transporter [Thermodesulfobacterium sp. TA1]|uniref:hemolysin family protein n=1 Tax=Thermodesulfobacterium sp. TA1 TaxID=2234087 RepID=UPI001232CD69|nr:hemolysin family protein [Thermodesulfobacterium sp. TA1]QER42018.1 HlyC/CorC family transporter [Thermodesulfobacterium sp. TA1]
MIEVYFFGILLLILTSMVFSSSEASIFSISRIELANLRVKGLPQKFLEMLNKPEELLVVLIASNEIVDFFTSFLGSKLFSSIFPDKGKTLAFFIFGFIMFWMGDFLPKIVGFKTKDWLITKVIYIIYFFYYLFWPIRKIYSLFYGVLERFFPTEKELSKTFSPVEQIILYIIEKAYLERNITEKEKIFIKGLFLSEKISVSAILTPRSEIVAFKDTPITLEFLEKIKYMPYNKFPVYKDSLDNLLGILYIKDIIRNFSPEFLGKTWLSELTRPVFYVPENFKLRDLIFEFQKKHLKIAIVVDEYGMVKGLVTLEDVLEELFGEIYEQKEAKVEFIQKIGENKWLVHGKVLIENLKLVLGLEIEEEHLKDIKILNGFLLALFKEIPEEGQSVVYGGYRFTVKKVKGRKILWVEIEKLPERED